jgi:hypothetical protein
LLSALDVFANVLTGGRAGQTISSRSYKGALAGSKPAKFVVGILNLFQKNHGAKAVEGDLARNREANIDLKKTTGIDKS